MFRALSQGRITAFSAGHDNQLHAGLVTLRVSERIHAAYACMF